MQSKALDDNSLAIVSNIQSENSLSVTTIACSGRDIQAVEAAAIKI